MSAACKARAIISQRVPRTTRVPRTPVPALPNRGGIRDRTEEDTGRDSGRDNDTGNDRDNDKDNYRDNDRDRDNCDTGNNRLSESKSSN